MSAGPSMPVGSSQHGNLFKDRSDAGLSWYLPAFTPVDPTDAFSFAASEGTTVDSSGQPFDTAVLVLALQPTDPPDVAAARQAAPSTRFQAIPADTYTVSLLLPYKDQQGADQTTTVVGKAAVQADGTLLLTFAGLLGPAVVQAYQELAVVGGASVQLVWTYNVWDRFFRPIRTFPPIQVLHLPPPPPAPPSRHPAPPPPSRESEVAVRSQAALRSRVALQSQATLRSPTAPGPERAVHPPGAAPTTVTAPPRAPVAIADPGGSTTVVGRIGILRAGPIGTLRPFPVPPQGIWTMATRSATSAVALGTVYAGGRYRPRYTITSHGGTTRPIVDASDLDSFVTARSEFRALTSLGDVPTKYPSLYALYYGQVSGTVVVIPAAYGIVRGKGGCGARIDAVVDTSPTSVSGCRFQFTCKLAPVVDPIDLAQLEEDLTAIPEAAAGPLQPILPTGIDRRVTPTFSAPVSNLMYADSPDGTVLMSFQVTDSGTTPALVSVNLLLAQLTSASSTPLFGTIGVRLDDVYTPPVEATVVTGLTVTSGTDDVAVSLGGAAAGIAVTNQSPNDLTVIRVRAATARGADTASLNDPLPAGQSLDLPVADPAAVTSALVQRTLAVPSPFPRSALTQYVELHAETVQQAMHSLTVNATSIDFAAHSIAEIDIVITLDGLPAIAVPQLALRPEHQVDSANVVVPIDAALTGLTATLTIGVHSPDGTNDHQVQLKNDFAANPILVLTQAALEEA